MRSATSNFFERTASPYPAASIAALGVASAVSSVLEPGPLGGRYFVCLAGLVLAVGAFHGLLWQWVLAGLQRAPRWLSRGAWAAWCLAAGAWLADRLAGFSRLQGEYRMLAMAVLAACGVGAVLLAWLLIALQPTAAKQGWLFERPGYVRSFFGLGFLATAAALLYVDRTLYVDLYPDAHTALRVLAVWLAMFALALHDTELHLPRPSLRGGLVVVAAAMLPVGLLSDEHQETLQAFAQRSWPSLLLDVGRAAGDFDNDGYALWLAGGDCAPLDGAVHPRAREIPNNGVDDNCMFGDAKRQAPRVQQQPVPSEPSPLDVVLITVDTLRRDHVGAYNAAYRSKKRATTPNIDRFAKRASVFDRAYTAGGWTSISLATMMRGMYARRLVWTRYYETNRFTLHRKPLAGKLRKHEYPARMFLLGYDDPSPALPQQLQHRGMFTAAIVDDGVSEMLRAGIGIERGFSMFRTMDTVPVRQRDDAKTTQAALSALRQFPSGRPFFLWVHYFGPHLPDQSHADAPRFGTGAVDLYDHEIAYLDQSLGPLLDELSRRKHTAVFLTADHGETFYGKARHHGQTLNESVLRVPLIASVPGWSAQRVGAPVSLIDLTPTILALTRTPAPPALDGVDLAPLGKGERIERRVLLSDTWRYDPAGWARIELIAAFDGRTKVVFDTIHRGLGAFDATRLDREPTPVGPGVSDKLAQVVYGYIDETGGTLRMQD